MAPSCSLQGKQAHLLQMLLITKVSLLSAVLDLLPEVQSPQVVWPGESRVSLSPSTFYTLYSGNAAWLARRFLARGHTPLQHLLPSKVQTHCFEMEPKRLDLKNKDIRSRAGPECLLPAA